MFSFFVLARVSICFESFTWCFVDVIKQTFAESHWSSVRHAVGPALKDCMEQKRLGPGRLYGEMGKLRNALRGGDRGLFAPIREGKQTKWKR